jgi:hypothetical protein
LEGDAVPGPGPETAFQKFCGAEYERVFEIAHRMIRDSTGIDGDRAEEMARKIAAAHADALYARLTGDKPAGGRRATVSRKGSGMHGERRSRAMEMHPGAVGARMGV